MKQRYNTFKKIHKGLRAMLYDTAINLQLNDFTNTEETVEVLEKLDQTLHIFYEHASHEDKFILPVIVRFNKVLAAEFDSEHEKDEFMTRRINSLVSAYHHAGSDEGRIEGGEAISKAFNEFIAFNLYHMNKEEEKINPVLWANYTDEEIRGIERTLVATISKEEMMITSKWMLLGINDEEIVAWLQAIKYNAPCFVFQGMMELAEKVLSPNRWNKIQGDLTEGLLLA
jgi:hypothetical protein